METSEELQVSNYGIGVRCGTGRSHSIPRFRSNFVAEKRVSCILVQFVQKWRGGREDETCCMSCSSWYKMGLQFLDPRTRPGIHASMRNQSFSLMIYNSTSLAKR